MPKATEFTIESKYSMLVMRDGRMPHSRPMFQADGIVWYVRGELKGLAYEQAANLAMQHAISMHINPLSVKRHSASVTKSRPTKTNTRRIF